MSANKSFLISLLISACCAADPKGHLQPIGSHLDKLGEIDVTNSFPTSEEFFNQYVIPNKPLLMKGVAKKFPNFQKWNNDTYLAKKFGKWRIVAEEGKKENRDLPVKYYTFRKFLSVYEEEDIYLVQDIVPQNPMAEEVCIPSCMLCGGFKEHIETTVMWYSSGGTKSVLHNDGYENVNCLLDGEKDLVFIDQKYKSEVPIDTDGGYSTLDVEKVDLKKYPTINNLPMSLGRMEAGDCLYIPYKWYHHVSSSYSRNMAVNFWFSHSKYYNSSAPCPTTTTECYSLQNIKFESPSEINRGVLFEPFPEATKSINVAQFKRVLGDIVPNIDKLIEWLDADMDGSITIEDVAKLPLSKIIKIFGEGEEIEFLGYHGDGKVAREKHIDVKDEL